MRKIILLFVSIMIMFTFLTGCSKQTGGIKVSGDMEFSMGENDIISWKPVEGAVKYEYMIVSSGEIAGVPNTTTTCQVRLMKDSSLHIYPIYADGSHGDSNVVEYGMVINDNEDPNLYVQYGDYDLKMSDVFTYNMIENIDHGSIITNADGSISFNAVGPTGDTMRFVADKVMIDDHGITVYPGGYVYALDSIGRICAYGPRIFNTGSPGNSITFRGGYTFNGDTSVDSKDELFQIWGFGINTSTPNDPYYVYSSALDYQPNMIGFSADPVYNEDAFTLSEMVIYYDEATYATPINFLSLDISAYPSYLEGDMYDPNREVYSLDKGIYDFSLLIFPELLDRKEPIELKDGLEYDVYPFAIRGINDDRFAIGDLKDASGNVLNKESDALELGSTLEIIIKGETYDMELPMVTKVSNAKTLHELVPYDNIFSIGEVTSVVIPISFADHPELVNDEFINDLYGKLGRVVDRNGTVTDHSQDPSSGFSLSSYFDKVSFDQYHINSFVTECYVSEMVSEELMYQSPIGNAFNTKVYDWFIETYKDMDLSQFDKDADGLLDSVIFIPALPDTDYYEMNSYGYALHVSNGYVVDNDYSSVHPELKNFVTISKQLLLSSHNVLLHEYGHNFGIIDYYDVSYSGMDAVGGYDMQSNNSGDYNPYTKYALGWIQPTVVDNLSSGQSVEYTIGSQSSTGDTLVIPAVDETHDGPFNEYIMVDLFNDTGVNEYDAKLADLSGISGVRIYHVNATMEYRELTNKYGDVFPIGTPHYANAYNAADKHHVEIIQRGGKNTFYGTNNESRISKKDFFKQGDVFDMTEYEEFFKDGKMDDGSEFGYTIEVVSLDRSSATIRITRK